jgi:site-specific DNA recombinase
LKPFQSRRPPSGISSNGLDRNKCSLGEVCSRLQSSSKITATGKRVWSRQTVWHVLQNSVYQGTAAYGKTRMMPRSKKSRSRPPKGRPAQPRVSNSAVAVDQKDWAFMPSPVIVDKALFNAAQEQYTYLRFAKQRDVGGQMGGLFVAPIASKILKGLVGASGFEPPTSWSRT